MPRDRVTPVDSPIEEETLRRGMRRVADHCSELDHRVGKVGGDVARLHQRLDMWGCPRVGDPPPMREEYHSSPEEVARIADAVLDRRDRFSERVKEKLVETLARHWKTILVVALSAAEAVEHAIRLVLSGHL